MIGGRVAMRLLRAAVTPPLSTMSAGRIPRERDETMEREVSHA